MVNDVPTAVNHLQRAIRDVQSLNNFVVVINDILKKIPKISEDDWKELGKFYGWYTTLIGDDPPDELSVSEQICELLMRSGYKKADALKTMIEVCG